MPRNGSGTMTVPNSFVPATTIKSGDVNANFTDIANELTNSLSRDGQAGMTAGQLKVQDGSAAAPGLAFVNHPNYGIYYNNNAVHLTANGYARAWANTTEFLANNLSAVGYLHLNGHNILEIGDIKVSARPTPSPGWLYCNGWPYSRTTYAALFAVIGTTYGAGDGSTTFNVPDCRGRMIASEDNMGMGGANRIPWLNYLGATGGEHQVYVTQWHLPNITLSANTSQDGYHAHYYTVQAGVQNVQGGVTWQVANGGTYSVTTSYEGLHGHNVQVPLGGSGGALNNVPPVIALHTFIYAGA